MIDIALATPIARPTPRESLVLAVLVAGLALVGWLCIYKTDTLVERARRRYERHWFVRAYPFSGMVMKDWYPAYLRFWGIVIWIWALVLIYLMWVRGSR
jgi:hypothetical protein